MRPRTSRSDNSAPERFAFFDSGEFAGDHEAADLELTSFVRIAILRRRDSLSTPADFAMTIAASRHAHSFAPETIALWATLQTHQGWPFARCQRSCEQAIKDAGLSEGGCSKLHVERHPVTPLEAHQAREEFGDLVLGISQAWGGTKR